MGIRVYLVNKILSGLSVILSLIVVSTCIWILVSLVIQNPGNHDMATCEEAVTWKYGDNPCENVSTTTQPPSSSFDDEHNQPGKGEWPVDEDTIVVESKKATSAHSSKFLTEFDEMDHFFYVVIIVCLSIAILAGLIQCIGSAVLIFSASYKIPSRSQKIVFIFFVIFILFLLCFGWPLAYKRTSDGDSDEKMHSISSLTSSFTLFIERFQMSDMLKDLTLYYMELFVNIMFLFLYMVVTCCLLRCHESRQYDI